MRYEVERRGGYKVIVEADTFSTHELGGGSGMFSLSPGVAGIHYVFSRRPGGDRPWVQVAAFSDVIAITVVPNEAVPAPTPEDTAALVN